MALHIKTGDRILIALIALGVAAGALWFALGRADDGADAAGALVVCQSKDGFYRCDPLGSSVSYTVGTPGTGRGADADAGENRISIHDGAVRVESANCGNQVCVQHDPVDAPGEQIVCLPHGVVVEIVANEQGAARLS